MMEAHLRLTHAHRRAGCGIATLRTFNLFPTFQKTFLKKNVFLFEKTNYSPFYPNFFSFISEKKGENIVFGKLNFFSKVTECKKCASRRCTYLLKNIMRNEFKTRL